MNPDATVVFNKSKLAKAIHEEADAGPSGADPFCQSFLCDLRNPAGLTGVHAHSGKRNLTVEDRTASWNHFLDIFPRHFAEGSRVSGRTIHPQAIRGLGK
jgi:hypothetical protein